MHRSCMNILAIALFIVVTQVAISRRVQRYKLSLRGRQHEEGRRAGLASNTSTPMIWGWSVEQNLLSSTDILIKNIFVSHKYSECMRMLCVPSRITFAELLQFVFEYIFFGIYVSEHHLFSQQFIRHVIAENQARSTKLSPAKMARQHQNEDRTFSVAFDAKMEAIQAAGTQRRKLMRDAWEDIDNGWRALEQRLVGVGIVNSSEQGMLRLNAGGSHVNVCQSVLRGEGPPESRTLASLFEKAWDKRLPRDEDGFIVLDESPTCMKRILHALLAASGTGSGTANIELLGDSLPPDEMAYLPYMFSALGLPALRSTVLEPHEFGELSATVLGWCPGIPSGLELIYRASRDGRTPQAFHSQCGDDEEQRAFTTLDARNDIINTAQRAANIIVDVASPCQHCGAQLFKGEFSNFAIFRHIPMKLSNSISPHADHVHSPVLVSHNYNYS